jgi:molybdopterin-guanine dinucleotide biosynthesis protein A
MERMVAARAGFVLAGGRSSRMGRDKALLTIDGEALLTRVARQVAAVAGSVTVIGPPERYSHLSLEVVPDRTPGAGPLGGIDTALGLGRAEQIGRNRCAPFIRFARRQRCDLRWTAGCER